MPPRLPRTFATVPCSSSLVQLSTLSSRPCVNGGASAARSYGRCRLDTASAWSFVSSSAEGLRPLRCCDGGIDRGIFFFFFFFGASTRRRFHASRHLKKSSTFEGKNHYERLKVSTNATPAEIKKSFYALSKTHHPDANRSDPDASHNFSLLSESYTVLSNASRRATYDRDVLRLHEHGHHHHHHHPPHHGSYHSTNPAGGRPPSGLSRRRGTFRGPPPSFYRSGGWGAHAEKRHQAHEESTGGAASSRAAGEQQQQRANPWDTSAFHQTQSSSQYGGMGPGSSPFRQDDEVPPHFDREGHKRTHERQDRRRWQRQRRAVGDDGIEFEPQTSLAGHFLIVAGILAATFVAPAVYLQFMRLGRRKKEEGG